MKKHHQDIGTSVKQILRLLVSFCVMWKVGSVGLICFLSSLDNKCSLFSSISCFSIFAEQRFCVLPALS